MTLRRIARQAALRWSAPPTAVRRRLEKAYLVGLEPWREGVGSRPTLIDASGLGVAFAAVKAHNRQRILKPACHAPAAPEEAVAAIPRVALTIVAT